MRWCALLLCALITGCAQKEKIEATSLLGTPLVRPTFEGEQKGELVANLEAARRAMRADPSSESAAIWYGRRLAYLGRYQEAIDVYTKALATHEQSYKLRRHRGHRYITVRKLALAVRDLAEAAALAEPFEDALEPDGAPNAMNIPRGTDKFNILYHLGLAHYLLGDFDQAAAVYEACREVAQANDDMLVATLHWSYMTYRRLGMLEEAEALLADVDPYMDVIENDDYLTLLLMYRHEVSVAEVIADATAGAGVGSATLLYGVGNWYLYNGESVRARALFETVVAEEAWAAFGHIAAEAELARMRAEGL